MNVGTDIQNNIKSNAFEEMPLNFLNNNCKNPDTLFIDSANQIEKKQHINRIRDKTSFLSTI